MREEVPPRLFELCLFDGEEISRIVSASQIPQYLSEAGKVLFSLDLFSHLEKDLQTFKTHQLQKQDSTEDLNRQKLFEEKLETGERNLSVLYSETETLKRESEELRDRITELKKNFDTHGGLQKEQRDRLVIEVNNIENTRRANSEKVRELTLGLLPL